MRHYVTVLIVREYRKILKGRIKDMNIEEVTARIERKYTIEFTESELKNLGMIVGSLSTRTFEDLFNNNNAMEQMQSPTLIDGFNFNLYREIKQAIK